MIDLRSDTVTRPTEAMRKAMAEAEVGDDVYGEDPTVNRLEKEAATVFGREAAIFVPTGTMGNQIAIRLHTEHGQEVICESRSHVLDWEMAMMAAFAGCQARTVEGERGILTWEKIRQAIGPKIYYRQPTGLVCLENSHNMAGGTVTRTRSAEGDLAWSEGSRAAGAPGRGAGVQCRDRAESERGRVDGGIRYGDVLPVEGTGSAGGIYAGGLDKGDRTGEDLPQGAGWRNAASRSDCGGRPDRLEGYDKAACGRSFQCKVAGGGGGGTGQRGDRPECRGDEHRNLRFTRRGRCGSLLRGVEAEGCAGERDRAASCPLCDALRREP